MAQWIKNPLAMPEIQEMWVWSLGHEDPLEKEMAIHSSIFAWEIPWTEKLGRLQSMGLQKSWTQLRLQQYVNRELPDVQAGFRKGRGTRDQIANICWIIEKARRFQKNIYFCFIDYAKAFDCVDHNQLWKILKEMGLTDHLTCFLRNLYASQEATVRTGHGSTHCFQIGKGVCQGCIRELLLHPTPVLLPGESNVWRSLLGCSPWGREE